MLRSAVGHDYLLMLLFSPCFADFADIFSRQFSRHAFFRYAAAAMRFRATPRCVAMLIRLLPPLSRQAFQRHGYYGRLYCHDDNTDAPGQAALLLLSFR